MTDAAVPPSGYTVDVAYPSAFGAFQAPVHMIHAAAIGGRSGPAIAGPFTYCDLGTGAGLTLCVLADCYPDAEFHGVDLNPGHVATARSLADRAGLRNVTFHQASFADLAALPLPRADFVTMSGIYSWLPPALRQAALAWIARALTPEGLVFLHYAALPGNSQIDPLYALIRETAATLPGDSVARFTAAVETMRRLAAANAAFFRANPYARAWLDTAKDDDAAAMAHEVLNAERTSLSVRDVADEAGVHDLAFVANAQIELNHMALVAPAALAEAFASAPLLTREMQMDAMRNAHSRMDVYARAAVPTVGFADAAGRLVVDRLSTGPLTDERAKLSKASGVDFTADRFASLLRLIDGRAITVAEVVTAGSRDGGSIASTVDALQMLVATKLVHLLPRPYASPVAPGATLRMPSRLNRLLLDEQIESAGPLPLASPIAGTQLLLPPADRLALLAMVGGDFDAAWHRIERVGQRLRHDGRLVTDARHLAEVAAARAGATAGMMVPHLTRLGILA
ncbi:methyltransferase domain-containing protein [Hephaestia sp. GCM10023244]|uniref:class I SAM-dependent methyltransferase n=1 Tax=unclassified Hephaestia TaxID=2631281 RepID=UPI002076FA83|nr:class I SAM-dependent methyltransferase [Hephaestia sp. MAHUQ-44]MCM8732490.1 class I SAM-dependent methyltransferase [Hephaestia sp. MAHUQ-44]